MATKQYKTHNEKKPGSSVSASVCIQFHKEARDTQDLLSRLDKELDQKYNPEFKDMYQMEGLISEIDVRLPLFSHAYAINLLAPPTASTRPTFTNPVSVFVCT